MTAIAPNPAPAVSSIASWYGSNRMLAKRVGEMLAGCSWVCIPFAGGMCEAAHIGARSLLINDVHRHLINMARVIADRKLGPKLYRDLRRQVFCAETLERAQGYCTLMEAPKSASGLFGDAEVNISGTSRIDPPNLEWAGAYFISSWMSRHGSAGTKREFSSPLSIRYDGNGGDSATHFFNAAAGIRDWRRVFRRATFTSMDFRECVDRCTDAEGIGIYCDAPFPGPGIRYKFCFTRRDHEDLARLLFMFRVAKVVCRFYDTPMVRELYPESQWKWNLIAGGRKQTNQSAPEVLLVKN